MGGDTTPIDDTIDGEQAIKTFSSIEDDLPALRKKKAKISINIRKKYAMMKRNEQLMQ